MGLDRFKKTPCGFAFVEFHHRIDALSAVSNLTGTKLDGRVIRVELDAGFKPGRQYGRGAGGGQVRDDRGGGSGRDRKRGRDDNISSSTTTQQQQPQTWGARWSAPAQAGGEGGQGDGEAGASIYGPADTGDNNNEQSNEGDEIGERSNKQPRTL